MLFSKLVSTPLGVLNAVVCGYFEAFLTHFGPCNFLESHSHCNRGVLRAGRGGGGWTEKGAKKGVKKQVSKVTPNHLGCSKCWILAIFSYL